MKMDRLSYRPNNRNIVACSCLVLSLVAGPTARAQPKPADTAAATPAGKIKWVEDFEAAKKTAAAQKKDLLIDFTGSDWCGWCIRLRQEVFDQAAFQTSAKDFVFVELDYPNKKPQSDEVKSQNARLKDEFSIEGYPTIFLADATGKPYAQTGYQAGGPVKYAQLLADLKKVRVQRDEAWAKAQATTGVERAKLLAKGLDALDVDLVVHHYKPVVDEITKIDPTDESGAVAKFGFQFDLVAANGKLSAQESVTAAQGREAMDQLIASHPKADNGQKQQALFSVLSYCRSPQDNEFVIKLMDDVTKLDPTSPVGKNAAAIKSRVEAKMKPATVVASDGAIDASKLDAIAAAKGKSVVIEGDVKSVVPTKSGGNLNVVLSNPDKGLMLFIPQSTLTALNDSNDGNFAAAIRNHRVRVRGEIDEYGGRDPRLKGRLQIKLSGADQIQLLTESPAPAQAAKPALADK